MGLTAYVKKRDFSKTKEPKAGRSKDKDHLMFVIQKHDASRLHYDFRLEMDGVLKSWAVPKGPSTDSQVKRLAMMVEDHPFDYRNFEGIIPQGEYGGGTVIVWDEGTYEPIEEIKGKKAQEKHLLKQLESGSVKIRLHGEKPRSLHRAVLTEQWKLLVVILEILRERHAQLAHIREATGFTGVFARPGKSREQNRREQRYDRYDDKQLNQREGATRLQTRLVAQCHEISASSAVVLGRHRMKTSNSLKTN